jgi:hypothetical protein
MSEVSVAGQKDFPFTGKYGKVSLNLPIQAKFGKNRTRI